MPKPSYERHDEISKELLDSICTGDLVKINDWKRPLRVKGISKDYFVMARKCLGNSLYSVCEKKPWAGIHYNAMVGGMFHCGTDSWLFGAPMLDSYDFDDADATKRYLESFELPEDKEDHSELSCRRAVPIYKIFIKRNGM